MNFQNVILAVIAAGLLFAATCSPTIQPIPAPPQKPDTAAYSTKAARDATIVAGAAP